MAASPSTSPQSSVATLQQRPQRSLLADAWQRLIRNQASVVGLVVIIIFFGVAALAQVIAPYDPLAIHSGQERLPPPWFKAETNRVGSWSYVLGTDTLGRDVFSRVLYGTRVSMVVGFLPTAVILIFGTLVGMTAAYFGGQVDNLLMRLADVLYGFPDLLFFIIVMVALRESFLGQLLNGLLLLFVALAIINWVGVARIVRGQVLSLKEKEFVEAARCIGVKDTQIMLRHILPNCLGPIIIVAAFTIPNMIITEATLGYLGIGLRPANNSAEFFVTSWGSLLLEGQTLINAQPFILLAPAICVALVVLAFTFLGDGLRDALDPRMRGTK